MPAQCMPNIVSGLDNWSINWYSSLLPQVEQQALFNAVNFSIDAWSADNTTAAYTQLSLWICPSESRPERVYGSYSVANYVGNYGGPGCISGYSGVIIPTVNLATELGPYKGSLGPIRLSSITDGTSNTAAFSERLVGIANSQAIRPGSIDSKRGVYKLTSAGAPQESGGIGAQNFVAECRAAADSAQPVNGNVIGQFQFIGFPVHLGLSSYNHYLPPNSAPCKNPTNIEPDFALVGPLSGCRRPATTRGASTSPSLTARSASSRTP